MRQQSKYFPLTSRHPFVVCWYNMHARCYNTDNPRFDNYGSRGITVCTRWHAFHNFYEDLFLLWDPALQLDRINNDGPYSAENCRFVISAINNRNRNSNKLTQEQAAEIRAQFRPGASYQEKLGKKYGISSRMVRYIGANKSWEQG